MNAILIIRRLTLPCLLAAGAALSGCASLHTVSSDVTSFGTWPGDMVPGTYSFDRLPSQQKDEKRQERLEAAASQALQAAGFKPAAEGSKGEVSVQLGARIDRTEPDPWDDPFWWPGPYHHGWYGGPWRSPWGPWGSVSGFGPWCCGPYGHPWGYYPDQFQREVALLIRDTASSKPLYETRAVSTGTTEGSDRILTAMFVAAMKEFPQTNDRIHTVSVDMPLAPQP